MRSVGRWRRAEQVLDRGTPGPLAGHHGNPPQPPNVGTLNQVLDAFRAADYQGVECFWLRLDRALVGGFVPPLAVPESET